MLTVKVNVSAVPFSSLMWNDYFVLKNDGETMKPFSLFMTGPKFRRTDVKNSQEKNAVRIFPQGNNDTDSFFRIEDEELVYKVYFQEISIFYSN